MPQAIVPALKVFGPTLVGGLISAKGSRDAAKTQSQASDRALEVFERNAGISQDILKESTGEAIATTREGQERGEELLIAGARGSINEINRQKKNSKRLLLEAYNLGKDAINDSSIASSSIINKAREDAAGEIISNFGAARSDINQARNFAIKTLQDAQTSAEDRMNVARAASIAALDKGVENIRGDYQPFLEAGEDAITGLGKLVSDPQEQLNFIQNNPFFKELAGDAERRLLENQAASGRVGTGSTQQELQRDLLRIGNDLLSTTVNQRLAVADRGLSAADAVSASELNRSNAIANIEQSIGMSLADLVANTGVNIANTQSNAGRQLSDLSARQGESLAANERETGRNLANIEQTRGRNIATLTDSTARAGADLNTNAATQIANVKTGLGTNLANLNTATTSDIANRQSNLGINQANILTQQAANTADTVIGQGDAKAAGIVGQTNALSGTALNLANIALERERMKKEEKQSGAA